MIQVSPQTRIFPEHPVAKIFICAFVLELCLILGLQAWEIILDGHLRSALVLFQMSDAFEFIKTASIIHALSYGLCFSGLLTLFLIGSLQDRTPPRNEHYSFAALGFCWLVFMLLEGSSVPHKASQEFQASFLLQITQLLHIYPTLASLKTFVVHSGYLVIWLTGLLGILRHRNEGIFHLQQDIYAMLLVGYTAFGGALATSFISSEAFSLLSSERWLAKVIWLNQLFMTAATAFAICTGLQLVSNASNKEQPFFEGLAFSHLFALALGFILIYIASPVSSLNLVVPESILPYLGLSLVFIWLSHSFYCYYASQQLDQSAHLNPVVKVVFYISLILFSLGLTEKGIQLLPSQSSHSTDYWSLLAQEFYSLGGLLFIGCFLHFLVQQQIKSHWQAGFALFRSLLQLFGGFITVIAILLSLYQQHQFEAKAGLDGSAIDFYQIQQQLRPVLISLLLGVVILTLATLLQLIEVVFVSIARQKKKPKIRINKRTTPKLENKQANQAPLAETSIEQAIKNDSAQQAANRLKKAKKRAKKKQVKQETEIS